MRPAIGAAVLGIGVLVWGGSVLAQATVQQQRVVPEDVCAGESHPDATSCAQSAMWDHNWPAFLMWAQKAAAGGSYLAADWLADAYESGDGSIPKDPVRAYMWYDIAARLHAREIQRLPPVSDPHAAQTNEQEVNYRDGVGEKLSQEQIAAALQLERRWFSSRADLRN